MDSTLIGAFTLLVALILLDLAALRFGVDSRVRLNPTVPPHRDI